MTEYLVFVQKFYDGCPEDEMVGTIEYPARCIGRVDITNNVITNIDVPEIVLWIMDKQLSGGSVNVLISNDLRGYSFFRNIPFHTNISGLIPDTVS